MGWRTALVLVAACGGHSSPGTPDAETAVDAAADAPIAAIGNRDRLITSYLAYLQAHPGPQSNGLDGTTLHTTCELWSALDPSSRATFLTITARLEGSIIALDQTTMLDHVTKLYRATGGQAATATDPGSCGGGEFNRLIMSMDDALHTALDTAYADQGMANGQIDIHDIPAGGYWRDSHDLGGPHAPFDQSDECNDGAPRGQTQYFKDPTSTLANTALGRQDLTTLIDPYALEMDEDYDCPHNSNPLCTYTTYGPACLPETSMLGVDIYVTTYGDYQPAWKPAGC